MKKIIITVVLILIAVLFDLYFFTKIQNPEDRTKTGTEFNENDTAFKLSFERGKSIYNSYCLTCHQVDGLGVPGMNPPLNTKFVTGDHDSLVEIILEGINEDKKINGYLYSNPMPPHSFLKDEQVTDVLNYVRNSFGNHAVTLDVEDIQLSRLNMK